MFAHSVRMHIVDNWLNNYIRDHDYIGKLAPTCPIMTVHKI